MPRILIAVTEQDYLRAMTIAGRLNRAAIKHRLTTYHTIPGVLAAAAALGLERVAEVLHIHAPEVINVEGDAPQRDFLANQGREMARRAQVNDTRRTREAA